MRRWGSERILVVDDEKVVLESTQFMLQQLGYHVTACASANAALTCFSGQPNDFDLVLSDMTMPRTSGVELLRRVRDLRSDIPVILMTGFAGLLNEEELKRYGIDEFIIKPLNAQELGINNPKMHRSTRAEAESTTNTCPADPEKATGKQSDPHRR